jgi:hypothetical protein
MAGNVRMSIGMPTSAIRLGEAGTIIDRQC